MLTNINRFHRFNPLYLSEIHPNVNPRQNQATGIQCDFQSYKLTLSTDFKINLLFLRLNLIVMTELEDGIELDQSMNGQEKVPNNVGVLVLGICSIFPGCFCYGIVGVICGIIALVMANKANNLIEDHPQRYTPESIQLVKAGKICGIIGLSLSALYLLFLIVYLLIVGSFFFSAASMGMQ